jgi:hypothetical protein
MVQYSFFGNILKKRDGREYINTFFFFKKKIPLFSTSNKQYKMTTTTIGQYLINRLKEVGIDTIFGVPGDFNLVSY